MFTVNAPWDCPGPPGHPMGEDHCVLAVESLEQLRAELPDVLWRHEKRLTIRHDEQHLMRVDGGGIATDELLDRVVELARERMAAP